MKKIVYNDCFGGFGLSPIATKLYAQKKGITLTFYKQTKYSFDKKTGGINEFMKINDIENYDSHSIHAYTKDFGDIFDGKCTNEDFYYPTIKRDDVDLVYIVETLGKKANGNCANLKIIEIEGKWRIDEYDGYESVETPNTYKWND